MVQEKINRIREVAARVGIPTELLDELGYTEILLKGGETPLVPVWIEKEDVMVWMLGKLRLTEDGNGELGIEVSGLNPSDDSE